MHTDVVHTHKYMYACTHNPVYNTMQRMDAADARIEPKSIPTYTGMFYPPHSSVALYCEPSYTHTHTQSLT